MKKKSSENKDKFSDVFKLAQPLKKSAIYMESNTELSVFRCKGLLEYSDECVNLRLTDGNVHIYGRNLGLKTFSNTEITVDGKIEKIEFEECVRT